MIYDYSKLLGAIKEKYGTQFRFANAVQISERSLSLKLNGKRDWKQKEIIKACIALNINYSEIPTYFFAECAQNIEQTIK